MAHSLVYWVQDLMHRRLIGNEGRIFAMTSTGSWAVWKGYGAVSSAKAALEAHIRQLACELGPRGITANAICAGVTDTPALRKIPDNDAMVQVALRKNPAHRLTRPEDALVRIGLRRLPALRIHLKGRPEESRGASAALWRIPQRGAPGAIGASERPVWKGEISSDVVVPGLSAGFYRAEVSLPAGWKTQNPFGSTYFAAQAMADPSAMGPFLSPLPSSSETSPLVNSDLRSVSAQLRGPVSTNGWAVWPLTPPLTGDASRASGKRLRSIWLSRLGTGNHPGRRRPDPDQEVN